MPVATIYTGETRKITIRNVYEISREPFPITGYKKIEVKLKQANRGTLIKSTEVSGEVDVLDTKLSKLRVNLTVDDTRVLKIGKRQDFEVEVTFDNDSVRTIHYYRALNIVSDF